MFRFAFLLCFVSVRVFGFSVFAYLPEWRYEGANFEILTKYVTHLIFFSLEVNPDGTIGAQDRLPDDYILKPTREMANKQGTKLLLCFGGNGRSAGFSQMVSSKATRARFLSEFLFLNDHYHFDGIDYNWEYPGYDFGSGYQNDELLKADYRGFLKLVRETKELFKKQDKEMIVTLAYYPDGKQEKLLYKFGFHKHVDYMHSMSYDQKGRQHSSMDFAKKVIYQGKKKLPSQLLTLGLPFYGRKENEWISYEDIVKKFDPLDHYVDEIFGIGFNSVETIKKKVKLAKKAGLGGVMIWEVGQDCRVKEVERKGTVHAKTCPKEKDSLLIAIHDALQPYKDEL